MQQTTCAFISGLLIKLSILFLAVSPCMAQNSNNTPAVPEVVIPFYNGITVGVDIYGIGSKVLGSDFLSSEVSAYANLKNRFFPIVEIGYGKTDTTNDKNIHYKSAAPYFKLGLNYNTMYKKNNPGFLYVGLRYAFSSMSYDIETFPEKDNNPNPNDEYWKTDDFIQYKHYGMNASMHWAEFLVGVQVRIYKQFHMGWSVRMKYRLKISPDEYGDPWYVPGFGKFGSSTLGLNYSLIYKLPF